MSKVFEKRFPQALAIVEARKVTNYRFKPSGRTLWVVKGRKGEYQVMPDSMFCTCDDYYFRVMDNKKQLCYHLVAQQIAEALGQYGMLDFADSQYAEVTSKWSDPSYQMGKPAYLVRRSEISISPREESNICRGSGLFRTLERDGILWPIFRILQSGVLSSRRLFYL